MSKPILSTILFIVIFCGNAEAQFSRYIIRLRDKATNPYTISNPIQYLSQRALDRRARYNIAIDSADLPVTPRYIDSIKNAGAVTILNTSRWLNQVAIRTTDPAALARINSFPFVINTQSIALQPQQLIPVNKVFETPQQPAAPASPQGLNDFYNYGSSQSQVAIHNGMFLHNHGFRGQGMQLAMMDAGFFNYLTLPTFDSVRNAGQILSTWDFVQNHASVNEDHQHGMNCLSTIAANMPGVFVGQAPKASFYLYRTEDAATEYPIEEQNWAAAAERADSAGADVTSTSLGYSVFDNPAFNHTYAQMDGNTTIIARAADMAAKKGILVVAAAGNDGNGSWRFIATPADADSTLTVGAVNNAGVVAGFSSYGPSSDGQIKPTLAAVGAGAVIANAFNGQPGFGNGTSFACPNLAGIATCLWQAFPEVNNMTLIDAMKESATRFTNPDDRSGYGIPDMKKSYVILFKKLFTLEKNPAVNGCRATIRWNAKSDTGITFSLERKALGDTGYKLMSSQSVSSPLFIKRDFTFDDDLSSAAVGPVSYRIRVRVSTDTSFVADSLLLNYTTSCLPPLVEKITANPNPVTDNLRVRVTKNGVGPVRLVLYNEKGQQVYALEALHKPIDQVYNIPMKHMAKGVYWLTVYFAGNKELVKKIVRG